MRGCGMREAAWIAVMVGVVGVVGVGCGPTLAEQFKRAEADGTAKAWRQFLDANELENMQAPEVDTARNKLDEVAFAAFKEQKTSVAMERYLEEFPEGQFTKDAIETLDDLAYAKAKEDGDMTDYLEEYPEGKHAEEARAVLEKTLFEVAREDGVDSLRAVLRRHPESKYAEDAWEALEAALTQQAGDAGIVLWRVEEGGRVKELRSVAGYAGGKAFQLAGVDLGLSKPLVFKKGQVKLKGKAKFQLVGDLPDEPVSAVVLVRVDGGEQVLSSPVKIKRKKVEKKRGGKLKLSLKQAAEGVSGSGNAYFFLVAGSIDDEAHSLRPVSNIVAQQVTAKVK